MADTYNIVIDQGADFDLMITYKDPTGNAYNLAGYSARMQVRTSFSAPLALLTLDTANNGGITLDQSNGVINISMSAANTANIPSSNCRYDLELVNGTSVTRLIEGKFTVSPEITK